ncbi:unnamed protein product [Adineta ricciae]|uniref:Uncharacterized protein n=1 Tax=Adineta ricciae TaxID=249248 RepID=A0A813TFM3_ADIRI|nr:unnamed protein product [Adineta ricciae]CAF1444317.1 unnamed protein product [Adineta ricciae]
MADSRIHETISNIIISNNAIKLSTKKTTETFLNLQKEFFESISTHYKQLETIQQVTDILFDDEKMKSLVEFKTFTNTQLVVCGYNSAGKTSFLHDFLRCGAFLPTGTGAVTARIVKFSYAPADKAFIWQHDTVESAFTKQPSSILVEDLSRYFAANIDNRKKNTKELKEAIRKHLARPEFEISSPEFAKWATYLIEIRIPSPILKCGLEVYDTAGLLGYDAPVLVTNLQTLVKVVRPSLLFLYDNPSFADDTLNCFRTLKNALCHLEDTGVFFLNTKADASTILRDAEIDEDDDELEQSDIDKLLAKERERRYELLINVEAVKDEMPSNSLQPTLAECDCFDIFSIDKPNHLMTQTMQQTAIDRIIKFAAERDLQGTKYVSNIILDAIDAFFDFVLVTNRRSLAEWDKLRNDALTWGDAFFQHYRAKIDEMVNDIEKRTVQKFDERRDDIKKKAFASQDKWHTPGELFLKLGGSLKRGFPKASDREYKSSIGLAVEEEVIKPVLKQVVAKMKVEMPFREVLISTADTSNLCTKSEIYARVAAEIIGVIYLPITGLVLGLKKLLDTGSNDPEQIKKQEGAIEHCLIDVKDRLPTLGEPIKANLHEWLEKNYGQFKRKIDVYYNVVQKTMQHREKAHQLGRIFSGRFARIECRLIANLDLAKNRGAEPKIDNESLGHGGFFTVHAASWNTELRLAAKILSDPLTYPDMAYLEAHFHRTVTRLQIGHMAPLRYLFEKEEPQTDAVASVDNKQLIILVPRYQTNLHAYLVANMSTISIDRTLQIVLDIARVIAHMHKYELVHRDVKARNILLDEHEQVFLADFGTCEHSAENTVMIASPPTPPELSTEHQLSYEGTALDIYSLGTLMYVVAPKQMFLQPTQPITQTDVNNLDEAVIPNSFRQLMLRCLDADPNKRPTASEVVEQLETIMDQVADGRPCLICLDQPRYQRCFPCGHKTMCNKCLVQKQSTDLAPECIICRQVFTSTQEDANVHTYVLPV